MKNKELKNKKNRLLTGFTIIELIVVIAIIAVLAAIVLVNISSYINKGKDAAARGNLATLLTNGAVYFDYAGNYTGFSGNALFTNVNAALNTAGYTLTYNKNDTAPYSFCASVPLKAVSANYCVDSTGAKKNASTCQSTGLCS
jgi:prepilin-type N-terminal cleavage/methylation domain-containing protein